MKGFHWYVVEHKAESLKLQKKAWHLSGDREMGDKEAKKNGSNPSGKQPTMQAPECNYLRKRAH